MQEPVMNQPLYPLHQAAAESTIRRRPLRRNSQLLPLEPRFMFDGAVAAAVAADSAHAAEAAAAAAAVPPAVTVRAADPVKDQGKKEVVLVDTSLADYKTLEAGVRDGVGIVEFDGTGNGLRQIAAWAATQSGLDAIHILSHGADATLALGTNHLTEASLASATTQAELAELGRALNADGDLLLYGCDVAAGDGAALLAGLAKATGADVAASTNLTGAARLGGDWTLESHSGSIEARELALTDYDRVLTSVDLTTGYADAAQSFTKSVDGVTVTFTIIPSSSDPGQQGFYTSTFPGTMYVYAPQGQDWSSGFIVTVPTGYVFDLTSATGAVAGTVTYHPSSGSDATHSGVYTDNGSGSPVTDTYSLTLRGMTQLTITSAGDGVSQDGYLFFTSLNISVHALPTTTVSVTTLTHDSGVGGDFITNVASNTISGTLSAALTATQKVQVSYDGGATWNNATSYTTGSSSWSTDTVLVDGTHTVQVRVAETFDGGTTYYGATAQSKSYTLDTTASAITFSNILFTTDNGSSNTDLITNVASQDIKATLSATLASGDTVWVSTNGGSTYTDVTSFVTGTALNWTGRTLSGSDTLAFKVTDKAGNDSTPSTHTYTIDTTAPTAYATSVVLSNDTGTPGDLITKTAAQTISGSLSASLGANEAVYVSVANGAWVAASTAGTAWSLSGQTLTGGTSSIRVKVTDLAGNDSATVYSASYTLDTTGPTISFSNVHLSADTGNSTDFITSISSQTLIATISTAPAGSDIIYGSIDNGSSWVNLTSLLSGTTLTWTGLTLSGSSTLLLKVTDNANNDGTPYSHSYSIDASAPATPAAPTLASASDSGVSSSDKITNDTTPTLTGTAEAGSTVTVYDGATLLGTAVATGGNWSYTTGVLAGGSHTFTASATDTAGNVSALSSGLAVTIDATAPQVSSISVPAAGAYAAGSTLTFIVHVDENVYVNVTGGTPSLNITIGGTSRSATYALGSGSNDLVFAYTVQAGETDSDGIVINSLATNGGTITDTAGNVFSTTLHSVGATNNVLVDTTAPAVSSVAVSADGTYYTGQAIAFTVNYDEAVTVNTSGGTPRIAIVVGATTRYASYVSGSGGSALTFAYNVVNGDSDSNGITVGALALNGGSIKDAAGNNAGLTLNNTATTAGVDVDGSQPSITSVDASTADGFYNAGQTITITVDFSGAVTVDTTGGTPTLALDSGGTATYTGGSGTSTLSFSYVVGAGENSADLDVSSTAAFALNGATIVDAGGTHQNASVLLATPGTAGSLSANRDLVIDTAAPTNTNDTLAFTPDTGASYTDLITKTAALTVNGTLTSNLAANEHVEVSFDNGGSWSLANDATGSKNWSLGTTLSGSNTIKVRVVDDAGNTGASSPYAYVLDTTAPTITISGLHLSADNGVSDTDFITNTGAQTVTATLSAAPAGSDTVYGSINGGASWTDITAMVSGTAITWTGVTLAGSDTIKFKVTDLAGNDGAVASQAYVVDTSTPTTTVATVSLSNDSNSPTDFITNVAAQTISGTLSANLAAGENVLVSLDNGATWQAASVTVGANSWSLAGQTLTASDTLLVKVSTDAGGDGAVTSQAYVYDTAASVPTVDTLTTPGLTPVLSGHATLAAGETMTVTVGGATYNVVPVAGAWSLDLATAVPVSGALTLVLNTQVNVTATVTDLAGNSASDATTGELIVGSIAPPVPPPPTTSVSSIALSNDSGASSTDFITNVAQQTISGGLSAPLLGGESVQVSVDGGANWSGASASGNSWSLNATLSGSNTILVRVIGAGGVGAAASHAYTLDTSAPATPVVNAQSGSALAPVLSGAATLADGETLNVTVGGASYTVDVSGGRWSLDLASATPASGALLLAAGNSYSVVATITDLAGNQSSASNGLTIAALPQVTGAVLSADSGASSSDFITNVAVQTVSGTLSAPLATGQTVEVSVDNGATWTSASASAASWSASVTLSGSNTLLARVTSAAGSSSPYSHAYVLDNTAPVAAPANAVVTSGGNVSGTLSAPLAAGDTLLASRDGGATWSVIASSGQAWTLSSDGASSVQLQVRNLAGNAGATLTVNTAQTPEPPVTTDPPLPPALPETPPLQPVAPILPVAPINPGAPATVAGTPVEAPVAGAGSGQPAAPLVLTQTSVGGDIATSWPGQTPPTVLDTLPSSVVLQAPDFDRAPLNNSFQIVALPALQGGGTLVAYNPIADVRSTSGERISVQVGSDAFAQSGSNANVELTAQSADGLPLPGWLRFDGRTARFEGTPPAGFEGTLNFKVIARDSQGRVATQVFKIVISKDGAKSSWHSEPAEPAGRAGLNEQLRNARNAGMARLAALSS
jgi:hypothetical protein